MSANPDRRTRKRERTRLAIQDAAFELFAAHGYRDTTISAIAEAADVAPRTVTVHFPAKEELLFDADPFTPEDLAAALAGRPAGQSAFDAFGAWMAQTMQTLGATDPDGRFWQRRALRAQIIDAEPELRGRARSSYYALEQVLAEAIGQDLGQSGTALAPRLAALTAVIGLRELYETDEVRALASPPDTQALLALVDRVLGTARAGLPTPSVPR